MNTIKRLLGYLTLYNRVYSKVWRQLDAVRAQRGKAVPDWAAWCFCPLAAVQSIIIFHKGKSSSALNMLADISILGGLAAWRATQSIYRFDPTVFDAIWSTPIKGCNLPVDVLYRLPEWCCYIETPGKTWQGTALNGFFVFLEEDANDGRAELRFVFDCAAGLQPFLIHLTGSTLEECIEDVFKECNRIRTVEANQPPVNFPKFLISSLARDIEPFVSLTLYLCSETAEIPYYENRPGPDFHQRRQRIFPPAKPRLWEVAYRTGAILRDDLSGSPQQSGFETDGGTGSPETERQFVRPHIRRAHWHGYWTGSKNLNTRKFILKWLPPVAVNTRDNSELIPVLLQAA